MKLKLVILFYVLLSFSILHGENYFVNIATGSDDNVGNLPGLPWKSITHALSNAKSSIADPEIIYVSPGIYNNSFETFPLRLKDYVSVIGADKDMTKIISDGDSVFFCSNVKNASIERLTIDGKYGGYSYDNYYGGYKGAGVYCEFSSLSIINCRIMGAERPYSYYYRPETEGGGIYCESSTLSIIGTEITDNNSDYGAAISFNGNSNVLIEGCSITRNSSSGYYGASIYGEYSNLTLSNSRIEDNSSNFSFISLWYNPYLRISSCIFRDCNYREISLNKVYNAVIEECSFSQCESLNLYGGTKPEVSKCIFFNNHYGISIESGSRPLISDCHFFDNWVGIDCTNSSPTIVNCDFRGHNSEDLGALFFDVNSSGTIENCRIENNLTDGIDCRDYSTTIVNNTVIRNNSGHGIYSSYSSPAFANLIISENESSGEGGGVFIYGESSPTFFNCLIEKNRANSGGAIYCKGGKYDGTYPTPLFINCTIASNNAENGSVIGSDNRANVIIGNSIIWGNGSYYFDLYKFDKIMILYSDIEGGFEGEENINIDPHFISGPRGEFYLSNPESGQNESSPCLNKGRSDVKIDGRTNRTDGIFDRDRVDMGYYYAPTISFSLKLQPDKDFYESGDLIKVILDMETAPFTYNERVDIYVTYEDSSGSIYSGFDWISGERPALDGIMIPEGLILDDFTILERIVSTLNPPIREQGDYRLSISAYIAGTMDIISNISTVSFRIE